MSYESGHIEPTAEMIAFFERRTNEHIERVRRCLRLFANRGLHREELLARAAVHDASKFSDAERTPYIWLTEFHRCRRQGEPFKYPAGMQEKVRAAVEHHMMTNRHHPEFHASPNDMSQVDLIEMVCDWTAMAHEFEGEIASAKDWADKTIGARVPFDEVRRHFVYKSIAELDRLLGAESS